VATTIGVFQSEIIATNAVVAGHTAAIAALEPEMLVVVAKTANIPLTSVSSVKVFQNTKR